MSDILGRFAAPVPERIDDQGAFFVQKTEERQPLWTAQGFHELIAAGRLQSLLRLTLLYRAMDRHEILVDDRLDVGGLDKTIEFLAPPSPGRVKNDKDGSMVRRGLRPGVVE